VKTAALVGGPEALRLLARWAPDPRSAVQRALAQVWRYFDPADYAQAVLRNAPLDHGRISVDDLAFLRDAPPATTSLQVQVMGPVDLSLLANCPALGLVIVADGRVSAGLEVLATLPELEYLSIHPPTGGQDLSFLADCPALTHVTLGGCTELSDLSALVSASRLSNINLWGAKHLRDLGALTELPDLTWLTIEDAPLTGGLAAMTPVLDRLKRLYVWSVPTVTSLDVLAGNTKLEYLEFADCPVADLEPLGTLLSSTRVWLRQLCRLNLAPLASLPQLRELTLTDMNEPVDLSPLAQTDHRLRVELRNTPTVGEPGLLVKVRRR
jgi:hypothetical protein